MDKKSTTSRLTHDEATKMVAMTDVERVLWNLCHVIYVKAKWKITLEKIAASWQKR